MDPKRVVAALAACGLVASCGGQLAEPSDASNPDVFVTPVDDHVYVPQYDVGPGGCGAVACELCDVSGYVPPVMGVPLQMVGACAASDITAYITACFPPGTSATCQAWFALDAGACTTCLTPTQQTASTWGAITCVDSTTCNINEAGCVDLLQGTVIDEKAHGGPGSCGDLLTASFGCEDYACSSCTSPTDFTSCVSDVAMNACVSYVNAEATKNGVCSFLESEAGSVVQSECFPQTNADIATTINVFCGTGT